MSLSHDEALRHKMAVWRGHLCHADPPVRLEGLYAMREVVDTLIHQEDTAALAEVDAHPARLITRLIAHIRRSS